MQSSLFAFFVSAADGDQANGFAAKLDFKLITWIEIEHGGVGLANQEVAIALHFCGVAEFAAAFTNAGRTPPSSTPWRSAAPHEGREIHSLAAILFVGDVAASGGQISFGHIAKPLTLARRSDPVSIDSPYLNSFMHYAHRFVNCSIRLFWINSSLRGCACCCSGLGSFLLITVSPIRVLKGERCIVHRVVGSLLPDQEWAW